MTDRQKRSIQEMRRAGIPYGAIAESVGLSANTVKSFCLRKNIGAPDASGGGRRETCKNCGKPPEQRPGKKRKLFCCDKCRSDWWNRNRTWANGKKAHRLVCQYCGAEFMSFGNKKRKYCGRDCYIRSRYGEGLP
jgi:uncharacterized protein YjcR